MACIDEKMAIFSMFIVSRSLYCILPIENTKSLKALELYVAFTGSRRPIYIAWSI